MYSGEVKRLRASFAAGKSREIPWRKKQLWAFLDMLQQNKKDLCDAVYQDLHKHPTETELMEIAGIQNEIIKILGIIDTLTKPEKISKSILSILNTVEVRREPYGVCLIIGAWNYPLLLLLQPLVGAIAAGNCVILKPSEVSAATASLLQKLIPKYLDNDCFSVVVAGPEGSSALVNENKYDYIFYTGSASIGRLIMQAAAKHLTPVTLELGGKNPCYVDKTCDLKSASRCIVWGKWTNCGQICVSPDYIVCEASMKSAIIELLKVHIEEFYGEDPRQSESYGRIVNTRHVKRLERLLEGTDIVYGGVIDEEERYFSPTIVTNVRDDALIRQEEVFGPILPIYEVENVDEAIEFIGKNQKSLQLSIFAKDRSVVDRVIAGTSSGGATVNELLMQHNELELPFGGVGESGMGCYHGRQSFDTFCHQRSYYESYTPEVVNGLKYPPYTPSQFTLLKHVVYNSPPLRGPLKYVLKLTMYAMLGVFISYVYTLLSRK